MVNSKSYYYRTFAEILTLLLREKVQEIEVLFLHLDQEIEKFQGWSRLGCKFGCGKCCSNAHIEATVLEFLPFAHHLYENDKAVQWLSDLKGNQTNICQILEPAKAGAGLCSEYPYRGLICRLFGFSARTDKYNQRELVTCAVIKTGQAEAYNETAEKIREGNPVPVMNNYYMRLHAIDADLSRDFYPINEAITKAIEVVLHHYAYRN
jgi:Fe-S-cluster containining protein